MMTVDRYAPDGPYAWIRLALGVLLGSLGGLGMWSMGATLPAIQAEFGVDRALASLPYSAAMLGFAVGGLFMGRLADRFGVAWPVGLGGLVMGLGFIAAAHVGSIAAFIAVQAVLIGMLGSSASFSPIVADVSLWFARRRGIAVAIAASGNYLAGAVWTPILEVLIAAHGWRSAYLMVGCIVAVVMPLLALTLRRRPDMGVQAAHQTALTRQVDPGLPLPIVQMMLVVAGISCCVAMSMPQIHIVAYCVDLGYGAAQGAQMLTVMMLSGIASRLAFGLISDRIGGLKALLISSSLQFLALGFFLPFDGVASLFLVSALFGLSQGGIVPNYALVVRRYFPAHQAGARVSAVLMATVLGMALGAWMTGKIFDLTGSYHYAFLNGMAFNIVNIALLAMLLRAEKKPEAA